MPNHHRFVLACLVPTLVSCWNTNPTLDRINLSQQQVRVLTERQSPVSDNGLNTSPTTPGAPLTGTPQASTPPVVPAPVMPAPVVTPPVTTPPVAAPPPITPPAAPPQPMPPPAPPAAAFQNYSVSGTSISKLPFEILRGANPPSVLTRNVFSSVRVTRLNDPASPTRERYYVLFLGGDLICSGCIGGFNRTVMVTDSIGDGNWSEPQILNAGEPQDVGNEIAVASNGTELVVAWVETDRTPIGVSGGIQRYNFAHRILFARLADARSTWSRAQPITTVSSPTALSGVTGAHDGVNAHFLWRPFWEDGWVERGLSYRAIFSQIHHVAIRNGRVGDIRSTTPERIDGSRDTMVELRGNLVHVFLSRDGLTMAGGSNVNNFPRLASRVFNLQSAQWEPTQFIDGLNRPGIHGGTAQRVDQFEVYKHGPSNTLAVTYWRHDKHSGVAVSCTWTPGICFETTHSLFTRMNADGTWKNPIFVRNVYTHTFQSDGRSILGGHERYGSDFFSHLNIEQPDGTMKDLLIRQHTKYAMHAVGLRNGTAVTVGSNASQDFYRMQIVQIDLRTDQVSEIQTAPYQMDQLGGRFYPLASGSLMYVWRSNRYTQETYPKSSAPLGYQTAIWSSRFSIQP